MRRFRSLARTLAAVGLAALVAAGCGGPDSSDPTSTIEFKGFFDSFHRGLHVDYQVFDSLEEMVSISDAVVIGEIESVRQGRTLGGRRGERGTIDTLLLWTSVTEVVRGELHPSSRNVVEVEVFQPEIGSVEELHDARPEGPMLFILQDTAGQSQPSEVDDSGADHGPGKPIYTIPTLKAAFIEREGGITTPFDLTRSAYDDSIEARTLDELAEEIRRMP